MKFRVLLLVFITVAQFTFAQDPVFNEHTCINEQVYQLYPTQNVWVFIKLDTRNGRMWQVQFSIDGSEKRMLTALNSERLVTLNDEYNGRFKLYPTENFYNFLLIDQRNGLVYQVQWSLEEATRGLVGIIN